MALAETAQAAALSALLAWAPCSVPEFGAFALKHQQLMDMAVEAYWEPRYRRFRCVAMAQVLAESSGNLRAVSRTGAKGPAQFMPQTWAEVTRKIGITCSPFDAKCSFQAYAFYAMQLIRYFKSPRPDGDRVGGWMTTAYHAGAGNADRAQRRCGGATIYAEIEPCLPDVIGAMNAEHNRRYVRRIASLFQRMTGVPLLRLPAGPH